LSPEPTAFLQGTFVLHGEMPGTFVVKPGSLFPAPHRMEEEGWISSFWGDSEI